jgi:hypothetical protein
MGTARSIPKCRCTVSMLGELELMHNERIPRTAAIAAMFALAVILSVEGLAVYGSYSGSAFSTAAPVKWSETIMRLMLGRAR